MRKQTISCHRLLLYEFLSRILSAIEMLLQTEKKTRLSDPKCRCTPEESFVVFFFVGSAVNFSYTFFPRLDLFHMLAVSQLTIAFEILWSNRFNSKLSKEHIYINTIGGKRRNENTRENIIKFFKSSLIWLLLPFHLDLAWELSHWPAVTRHHRHRHRRHRRHCHRRRAIYDRTQ